jgi:hypothetical protein
MVELHADLISYLISSFQTPISDWSDDCDNSNSNAIGLTSPVHRPQQFLKPLANL